jgi:exo-beta-1,3-glucanase (GH17 family)
MFFIPICLDIRGPDHADGKFEEEFDELKRLVEKFGDTLSDFVLGITVGSEAIYREDATVDEMIAYMNQVYEFMQENSATQGMLVSIVDVQPVYALSSELRAAVNVTYPNTFPFWSGVPIDDAIGALESDLGYVMQLPESRGKPFILGETGWPANGTLDELRWGTPDRQQQHFAEAYCFLNYEKDWAYFWFTGIDNAWRLEQDPDNKVRKNDNADFYSSCRNLFGEI